VKVSSQKFKTFVKLILFGKILNTGLNTLQKKRSTFLWRSCDYDDDMVTCYNKSLQARGLVQKLHSNSWESLQDDKGWKTLYVSAVNVTHSFLPTKYTKYNSYWAQLAGGNTLGIMMHAAVCSTKILGFLTFDAMGTGLLHQVAALWRGCQEANLEISKWLQVSW
jgi:hypothetical protein